MLIEMVALSLTVLTSLPVLTQSVYPLEEPAALESTIPEEKLIAMLSSESEEVKPEVFSGTSIPEEQIVAMLSEPTPTSTPTPIPPTETPTPTATPTPVPPTETPTPTPTSAPVTATPQPSSGDLESLFSRYSEEYKVDRELLKRIAACESGFNASSHNTTYDYGGMFQFAASSWATVRGRMGADQNPALRFSAEEAIKTAAYHIANGGVGAWPNCQ